MRALLEYLGDTIELPMGETIVGRDLVCQIRLNDPAVSRKHVRIRASDTEVTVEDLGSSNGTKVNGERVKRFRRLSDGDEVQVGNRILRLKLVSAADSTAPSDVDTLSGLLDQPPATPNAWTAPPARPSTGPRPRPNLELPAIGTHTCPSCRRQAPIAADRCPSCGYEWPKGRPASVTQLSLQAPPERRSEIRRKIEVAVMYASETLTFEAVARDLSNGGMFVATELLDPIGTDCRIIVLADGSPAVSFNATVAHVVDAPDPSRDLPAGLGIRFVEMSQEAHRWLVHILARLDGTSAAAPSSFPPPVDGSSRTG